MLDLAKAVEEDNKGTNLLNKIMDKTHHERKKLVVKWEKDNEYIDEKAEEYFEITPAKKMELLQEVREEEEKRKDAKKTILVEHS